MQLQCNAFNIADERLETVGAGVYLEASRFNHSCRPNAVPSFAYMRDRRITVKTKRVIKKGEEITISYTELFQTCEQRAEDLWIPFFFRCTCPLCSSPEKEIYDKKALAYQRDIDPLMDRIDLEIARGNISKVIEMHQQKRKMIEG